MNVPLFHYVLGTPLGVLGLIRWGTRQVAVENGQVVRTGSGALPDVAVLIPEQNADRMRVPA